MCGVWGECMIVPEKEPGAEKPPSDGCGGGDDVDSGGALPSVPAPAPPLLSSMPLGVAFASVVAFPVAA